MLTSQEIYEEYVKCITDPAYVIESYLETSDLTRGGYVPFKLFPRQRHIIDAYEKYDNNLVTKPRQAGVSTTTAAYLAVKAALADLKKPESILIIANKQDLAINFLSKIKEFLEQLPRWMWGNEYYGTPANDKRDIFVKNSEKEIKLPNGSRIKAVATSKDALRGFTPTYLVMDEAAYIENGAEVYTTAQASLSSGGKCMLISTPNSLDSLYYETYRQAKEKKNDFNVVEMRWYEDLRYNKGLKWIKVIDENNTEEIVEYEFTFESYEKKVKDGFKATSPWYESMCRKFNNNARMIAQELDVSFIGSGGNVIETKFIEFQETHNVREPKYMRGADNEIWVWEDPIPGHQYILACLPPDEKVLTDSGLKNIQDVLLTDKLVNQNGNYVNIINKQIYPVTDEDVYEIGVDNTFRTTKFTKEHPILISKPILKRNYNRKHPIYRFNERYWDWNFNFEKASEVEIGDWIKVPNMYKKTLNFNINDKWNVFNDKSRIDFRHDSPLEDKDFWWLIGLWLGDGWLGNYKKDNYKVSICFNKKELYYVDKCRNIIEKLFDSRTKLIDQETIYIITFNCKILYQFILENFGKYSYGKKISEWVKYLPNEYKIELINGYFNSDGCWVKIIKNGMMYSKISFVSINLELLESIQDILFSLGLISSLNKLRDAGKHFIDGQWCDTKQCYNLCLANFDSLKLIEFFTDKDDIKLKKFNCEDFNNVNNRIISSCHFDKSNDFIYFRVKKINKSKFTGNVYNFECETNTFMCHHITSHNCDVARGDGADSSTIEVIDFTTMEQVMEYKGKVQPDLLAYIVKEWGDKYQAYTVADITGGMGVPTVLKLLELGYTRLHYDNIHNPTLMAYANAENKQPGFTINSVRTPMISHLEYSIRENLIKVRSQRLISEMKTFVFKNGKADHMFGYHDDLLMGLAMGLWVLEHSFKNLERVNEQTKAMLNAFIGYDPLKGKPTDQPKVANPFLKQTKQNRIGGSNILWIPPR